MNLDSTQLQTLKAAILAETDPAFVPLRTTGQTGAMAAFFNTFPTVGVLLWQTRARVNDILDAVTWDKFTPTDAPDGTEMYSNRMLSVQTKQMNLQNMLIGRETIDATKANIRLGLRDAVIQLPTGTGGALVSAGGASGVTVLTALTRPATRGEALYVGAPVATGSVSAAIPVLEGLVSNENVVAALAA